MQKKHLIACCFVYILLTASFTSYSRELKILQFNIWQEGTMVTNGFDAIVNEIDRLHPDFVTFSEVRNYKHTKFCERMVAALAKKGKQYFSFFSDDSGLLSLYPIKDSAVVFNSKGTIHKLLASVGKQEVAVYTAHLDYENYAVYLPRGYDGNTWKKMNVPVTAVDSLLAMNRASARPRAIQAFIQAVQDDIQHKRIIFLGGDFNEDSHLDWTAATKDSTDHHGAIVPWDCSVALYAAGFKDSYRVMYPDPVTYPGFTFPASNTAVPVSKLAWAPDADERDRIDFIYYYPNPKLSLRSSIIVGPDSSIVRNERAVENSKDAFLKPQGVWPSDHKAVMSVFRLKE